MRTRACFGLPGAPLHVVERANKGLGGPFDAAGFAFTMPDPI